MKLDKDGLDALPDIQRCVDAGPGAPVAEDDSQRMKWFGLFTRKQTPGHMMMRIRSVCGRMDGRQWRVLADVSDEQGKGFCDLTTRQQVQLRWFTIAEVPEIWRRMIDVGLTSVQTGMDNVRGVCGCPAAGISPHETLDGTRAAEEFTEIFLGNKRFTNLPRKLNVTITGCRENCCHPDAQDIGLVPAMRTVHRIPTAGFNVLVGGKQGSGGMRLATPLDVFALPEEAADLCRHITLIFRDFGPREARNRARLAFLVEERGADWLRDQLQRRCGYSLRPAGEDQRYGGNADHIGIHPQKQAGLFYAGLLVPVGRITTAQMRGVADLADRYGNGQIRLTASQNVLLPGIAENRLAQFEREPLLAELPHNPSPVMRGLVSCTGIDYCHMALIETKGWAIDTARRLEAELGADAQRLAPLSIRWSGCSAGCGLHQAGTIGLQACRSRQADGQIVDAAHVYVGGRSGPDAQAGRELFNDVPCEELHRVFLPIVKYLPRTS
jgi:ferredoxin-nitrite reductase